jgi:hypothetical protein
MTQWSWLEEVGGEKRKVTFVLCCWVRLPRVSGEQAKDGVSSEV